MPRQTLAHVDLAALRYNYRLARGKAGETGVMAVVKADGYGHGIVPVARTLAAEAGYLAVACIEEALQVREAGITEPVVLLEGVHQADDLEVCQARGFEPVLHSEYQLAWVDQAPSAPVVWLKVNTGMNRLGFAPESLLPALQALRRTPHPVTVRGLMTHFACADDPADDFTRRQTECFHQVLEAARRSVPELWGSVANSAAHFHAGGQALYDWSRPGIMLYGASPMLGKTGPELGLKPVMTLESRLIATRVLSPGESVGYGGTWRAVEETLMGVVAVGYGDGYPRHAGTGTPAAVNGQRVSLIGRVSMDMLAVDLSNCPEAEPGDPVELWGGQVSVDEVATSAGTIGYELLTGVTQRVPRRYHG